MGSSGHKHHTHVAACSLPKGRWALCDLSWKGGGIGNPQTGFSTPHLRLFLLLSQLCLRPLSPKWVLTMSTTIFWFPSSESSNVWVVLGGCPKQSLSVWFCIYFWEAYKNLKNTILKLVCLLNRTLQVKKQVELVLITAATLQTAE